MQHQHTVQCKKGAESNRWCLAVEEERVVTLREFCAYGSPLEMVTSFIYLGRVISEVDDYWPAVVRNLAKARSV